MRVPAVSVVIPVRNDQVGVESTVASIVRGYSGRGELEIVVVDDASEPPVCNKWADYGSIDATVKLFRVPRRLGVPRARNHGARKASGETLVMTDSHVEFSKDWDRHVMQNIRPNLILAATIGDSTSRFKGYGCAVEVPSMGTRWIRAPPKNVPRFVEVPAASGTVISRELFEKIGGYDEGMMIYGGAEPEFGVRSWLSGAEILSVPEFLITHRFKPRREYLATIKEVKMYMAHNALRFGMLYLSDLGILQMLKFYTTRNLDLLRRALKLLRKGGVWERRDFLEKTLMHDFAWFVKRFEKRDLVGRELL